MSPPITPGAANPPAYNNQSWNAQQGYPAAGYTGAQSTQGVQTEATAQAQAAVRRQQPNASTNSPDLSNVDFTLFVDEQNQIAPAAQASQSSYSGANPGSQDFPTWSAGGQSSSERPKRR